MLKRVALNNYRVFEKFSLDFEPGLNILVGDNDSGKSTILEAVQLALTGRLGDRWLGNALSPYLFNQTAVTNYVSRIQAGEKVQPPELIVDLFIDPAVGDIAALRGTNNLLREDAPGLRVRASFNPAYNDEYLAFISSPADVSAVPTEYYQVEWLSFGANAVTARSIPASLSRIDASAIRLQSGADYYLQQIIQEQLPPTERAELARAYRTLREAFAANQSIQRMNTNLAAAESDLTDRRLSLSIDISSKTAWESSLVPHLDELPFQFIGNGSQSSLKILLALNRSVDDAHVVLIEEPENHLSPGSLNALIKRIADRCEGKQVLVSTHSSYVLNKLGLDRLVLLHGQASTRLSKLPPDTLSYFKKLSGYDTLRLVLAKRVVLVEGPSDELLVQRAYLDRYGRLPLEAGIDVINARGLSFKRFLDIAKPLGVRVSVITDNDGRTAAEVLAGYAAYLDGSLITIHTGELDSGKTLEPQVIAANGREQMNRVLASAFASDEELEAYNSSSRCTGHTPGFGQAHAARGNRGGGDVQRTEGRRLLILPERPRHNRQDAR
ncbi:MAG: AAA family ATPase [Gaiellaceae bacterium]|jgi:energy-coupling factor transporter ATP-binding protein EcfA2